jgi:glycosyltransferase involved in cell wall biosynthesis
MIHPLNFDSPYAKYFVSYINYEEEIRTKSIASGVKVAKRTIYSHEAREKINDLIRQEKPDVAHVQNIHHHITPSIFSVLKENNIPIIWTLHDYTIICPNTSFLANGEICEKCKKRKYFWPSIIKCKKNSFAASSMAAIETTAHVALKFYSQVDFFISPSKFLKNKLIEYGIEREKIIHLNNFTSFTDNMSNEIDTKDKYFMYLGRLSEEKGIKTLIDAAVKVFDNGNVEKEGLNNYTLKIIGDGPLMDEMVSYVKARGVEGNIEFLGHKGHEEAMGILKGSKFLVIPSEWYENYPYSVLESFALAKPVIGARIGGIPELVKNWETGLLFEPGNADMLSLKIKFFLEYPEKAKALGESAKKFMLENINAENHYSKLIDIYKKAVELISIKDKSP